jgi:hypothetical protein
VLDPGGRLLEGHHLRQIYDSHVSAPGMPGRLESQDIITAYTAAVMAGAQWNRGPIPLSLDAPEPVRRVMSGIAPIAPHEGVAVRFDAHGEQMSWYVNGQPWHGWTSLISARGAALPELAILEVLKKI